MYVLKGSPQRGCSILYEQKGVIYFFILSNIKEHNIKISHPLIFSYIKASVWKILQLYTISLQGLIFPQWVVKILRKYKFIYVRSKTFLLKDDI